LQRKRRALDRLIPTIRATADPLTRDLYLTRAAEVGGVSKELLAAEANRPDRSMRSEPAPPRTEAPRSGGGRTPPAASRITRGVAAEAALVRVMLRDRSQMTFLLERLGTEDFQDPAYREIFTALVEHGADTSIESLAVIVSAAAVERLEKLLADDSPLALVDDALRTIECRKIRQRSTEIDELRRMKRGDGDALFAEKGQLAKRAQELKCPQQYWK
jgi:DNA primase